MPLAGLKWDIPPSKMLEDLVTDYATAIRLSLMELAKAWSPIIETYMKINAPWEDRTSNARQGLNVRPREEGHIIHIDLAHTMEYGIYLELANAGAWAIINPTLDIYSVLVWDSVLELLKS
jgi:hypothetical protein